MGWTAGLGAVQAIQTPSGTHGRVPGPKKAPYSETALAAAAGSKGATLRSPGPVAYGRHSEATSDPTPPRPPR